jgi:N-sulfoglucosamine sulfohydrolase
MKQKLNCLVYGSRGSQIKERKSFKKILLLSIFFLIILWGCSKEVKDSREGATKNIRPNILFAISDDQSYPHASAYGSKMVNTPAFDKVASNGVLFQNAFVASPGCAPSRAALLTGRYPWQIEDAGTHASGFPAKYVVYPDLLEEAGYFVGYTQKGWGPGNWEISGRKRNPAGNHFNTRKLSPPYTGISTTDYAANFADFLAKRPQGTPFCFWYGASEPHRVFEKGSGLKAGKSLADAEVPAFLPDTEEIRSDLLDYAVEIEWFDQHLGKMLKMLEEIGELDNTIVVVTSDNGMAFPRAKANLYEYGFRVPLAISWGNNIKGGRSVDDLVSLIDLAPTFLEIAGVKHPSETTGQYPMSGRSLLNILNSEKEGLVDPSRTGIYSARERHSSSRWNNLTYPQRSLRTERFLYTRNFKPDRWPAGDPQKYEADGTLGPMHDAYHDIDACPTQDFLVQNHNNPEFAKYFHWAVDKRPAEEFFDIVNDPYCLNNLAGDPSYRDELLRHRRQLGAYLMETEDPRVTGNGDIYESYIRYSPIRQFPAPDGSE